MKATLLTLTLLALTLLAGGAHGQFQDDDDTCMKDVMSGFGHMPRMVRMMAERFQRKGGIKWVMKKVHDCMGACVCKKVEGVNATEEAICNCIAEIKICDMQHKPNSTTPVEEIKDRVGDWIDCMNKEKDKVTAALQCKEMVMTSPLQMICMTRGVTCSDQDEDGDN